MSRITELLNSLWYRAIQALNESRRDSGKDPPNSSNKSAFDFTASERDWSFLLMYSPDFLLYLDLRAEQANLDSFHDF